MPPGQGGTCCPHTFALPSGPSVPSTELCYEPVPARADALLQVRGEGCSGDADLVVFLCRV